MYNSSDQAIGHPADEHLHFRKQRPVLVRRVAVVGIMGVGRSDEGTRSKRLPVPDQTALRSVGETDNDDL